MQTCADNPLAAEEVTVAGSEGVTVKGGIKGGAPVLQDEGALEGGSDLKEALQVSAALVNLSHE